MTTNQAVSIVDSLGRGWYYPPKTHKKKMVNFIHQSYSSSAIEEIKIYLKWHMDQNPIDVIEDFRYMVDNFACETKNPEANFMFSVYYDVATDVLDTLLTMK